MCSHYACEWVCVWSLGEHSDRRFVTTAWHCRRRQPRCGHDKMNFCNFRHFSSSDGGLCWLKTVWPAETHNLVLSTLGRFTTTNSGWILKPATSRGAKRDHNICQISLDLQRVSAHHGCLWWWLALCSHLSATVIKVMETHHTSLFFVSYFGNVQKIHFAINIEKWFIHESCFLVSTRHKMMGKKLQRPLEVQQKIITTKARMTSKITNNEKRKISHGWNSVLECGSVTKHCSTVCWWM